MLNLRKPVSRRAWSAGLILTLAAVCLAPVFTAHAQDENTGGTTADPVRAAAALVELALAATDLQAVINLLEGPAGAYYDASVSVDGDDGVGIIPHLEAATGRSAGEFAGGAAVESEDPLLLALAGAVAVDEALTAALAGGDADPTVVLQEQAEVLEAIKALLSGD